MALTKVSTDGVKDDAITKTKIPANQIEASELADNAVDTNAIADQAVSLSKLPHGTSSNNGKFLRANNGADPSFETVSIPAGTTINNNADNRLITGSGTANTLNGESGLTFDGDTAAITRSGNSAGGLSITNTNNSQASAHARLELSGGDNASAIMRMECNGHANEFIADGSGNLRVDDNGIERIRLDSSGNILCVANGTQSSLAPFFISVIGRNSINYGGGGNDTACLRIEDKGSNNSYYHGIELRTKRGGDVRMYAHDQGDDTADLVFALDGGTSPAEKVRMLNTGGITFNGDTAAANALDDYEEGTWTPQIQGTSGAGTASYNTQRGRYLKVGNLVYLTGYCGWTSGSAGGELRVTDLPFSALSNSEGIGSCMLHSISFQSGSSPVVIYLGGGTNYTYFYQSRDNNSWISLNYDDAGYIIFNVTYRVA